MYPITYPSTVHHLHPHPKTAITQIPIHTLRPSPYKHSQTQGFGLVSQMSFHNQRVSTVSSQKLSMATRETKNECLPKTSMVSIQSPRSERFFPNSSPNNIERSINSSRREIKNEAAVRITAPILTQPQQKQLTAKHSPLPVKIDVPTNSQYCTNQLALQQIILHRPVHTIIQQSVEQTMLPPSKTSNHAVQNQYKIQQNLLVTKNEVRCQPPQIHKIESSTPKRTITRSNQPPLISNVSVQSFQLPPKIRNPPQRINNRLYRSAVYDRRCLSVRPVSRAQSTVSMIPKTKKRDILIRCHHRSFISDKKIPVIGSYVSKDKSKNYTIRQFKPTLPKVLHSKIVSTEVIEVIPTEVIKISVAKFDDERSESCESSIIYDDMHSFTSNPIIDQPTLIKKYVPLDSSVSYTERQNNHFLNDSFSSSRSRRLSDHIKVSVYKSPSVVIKKAQTITSGPKLSKNHVIRVAAEGKIISGYRKEQSKSSSRRSASPHAARYQTANSKLHEITSVSNPYVKHDVPDILSRLKKEAEERTLNDNLEDIIPASYEQSVGKDSSNHETMLSDYHIASSRHTVCRTETHLISSTHKQETKREIVSFTNLQSVTPKKEMSFVDYLNSSHIRKQSVNKILFESPIDYPSRKESSELMGELDESKIVMMTERREQQVSMISHESSLSLQNLNKHKYKIPKLSSDLEEDLRKLRLQNERKRKELEENWATASKSSFLKC